MGWLIPWKLLDWAKDNRVLRLRWFGLEVEFLQQAPVPGREGVKPDGRPMTEAERMAEYEKTLMHSVS